MAKPKISNSEATAAERKADSELVAAAKLRYQAFLARNPETTLLDYSTDNTVKLAFVSVWGDSSVALNIPDDNDTALLEALSHVRLPPKYTAIYHDDDGRLEIIWTAFKLGDEQEEIKGRQFSFRLKSKTYKCHFGKSSERLLEIAKQSMPLRATTTNFRNLRSFAQYSSDDKGIVNDAYSEPYSFWIEKFIWSDDLVLELVRHINFYLRYYDAVSPVIEIHPNPDKETLNPKSRYVEGKFPSKIVSQELQPALLVFFSASFDSNKASNFLNLYRIVEFVSYGHMHDSLRKQIRSVLHKPSALDDLDRSTTEILMMLREAKLEREQETIVRLMTDVIPVGRLWNEVCQNKAFFSKDCEFDGDLVIKHLISDKDTLKTFEARGVENFARAVTQIRNALAHGKDSKTAKTVLPTSRNFELLGPWVHLMAIAAAEVVLYDGSH